MDKERRGRADKSEAIRQAEKDGRQRQKQITARKNATQAHNANNSKPASVAYKQAAFYVPDDLDLDTLLANHRWYGAYLLNLIHMRSAYWREDSEGYVRLKAEYIHKVIPQRLWRYVRNTLVGAGVVEWDQSFDKGRSQGYRLRPEYRKTHRIVCLDDKLNRKIAKVYALEDRHRLPVHRWLEKNLERLRIDMEKTEGIIDTLKPKRQKHEYTIEEYRQRVRDQVTLLRNGDYRCTVCRFGRFHSPITRLPRELRSSLSVDGVPLVNVDLANSQPLILGILVLQWLSGTKWARSRLRRLKFTNTNPYHSTDQRIARSLYSTTFNSTTSPTPIPTPIPKPYYGYRPAVTPSSDKDLGNVGAATVPPDHIEIMQQTQQGKFYESLMTEGELAKGKKARSRLKVRFYRVLFGRNKSRYRYRNKLRARFRERYPTAAAVLKALKERNFRHSSHVLQNTEATMFIYRVCGRIMREKPNCFVATIHDSILTTPDNLDYVEGVIREEFARLGVSPTLRREIYGDASEE